MALLNDCKYGHDAQSGALRITLLRGPTSPDPEADLGRHEFSYAFYPHRGRLSEAVPVPVPCEGEGPSR